MLTAVASLYLFPPKRDWFRVLTELERAGVNNARVASALGVAESTVNRWKQGSEPKHSDGQNLLALHEKYCMSSMGDIEIPKTQANSA